MRLIKQQRMERKDLDIYLLFCSVSWLNDFLSRFLPRPFSYLCLFLYRLERQCHFYLEVLNEGRKRKTERQVITSLEGLESRQGVLEAREWAAEYTKIALLDIKKKDKEEYKKLKLLIYLEDPQAQFRFS